MCDCVIRRLSDERRDEIKFGLLAALKNKASQLRLMNCPLINENARVMDQFFSLVLNAEEMDVYRMGRYFTIFSNFDEPRPDVEDARAYMLALFADLRNQTDTCYQLDANAIANLGLQSWL